MSHDIIQHTQRDQDVTLRKNIQSLFSLFFGLKCVLYHTYLLIAVLSLLFGVEKCLYANSSTCCLQK